MRILALLRGLSRGGSERVWHTTQQLAALPDGGLEMSFHAGGPFEIRRWILGWGDAVEVISPRELAKGSGAHRQLDAFRL